ncbi:autotransporter outer membrane beta-barrel domain-containing protein [Camelimonas abortus]|uniref:Autotransporter outer membrane beta-barrel domain-containing protein n=1 Tax=Camelimonas abortus TaxID=1017184 RepID=A0ABV7LEN2_9HYPH
MFGAGDFNNIGVYVASGRLWADASGLVSNRTLTAYNLQRTGKVELTTMAGGAYWTHYSPWGGYLDAVVQLGRHRTEAASEAGRLKVDASDVIASLEAGYPVGIAAVPGLVIEPQAQVLWQRIVFSNGYDRYSNIDPGVSVGASGRIGVRGRWRFTDMMGHVYQAYLRVNLWQDSGGRAMLAYNHMHFAPLEDRSRRIEISAGATARLSDSLALYGHVSWEKDIWTRHHQGRRSIGGAVGLSYTW